MAIEIVEDHPLNWYVAPESCVRTRMDRTIDHAEALAQTINCEEFKTLNDAIQHRVIGLMESLLTSIRVDWQELERIRYEELNAKAR